jgi:hypothetical protein
MAIHHFVPQFYLKNFALSSSDPRVWVYRRTGEPQKLPIKTIAAVQGFYKVTIAATGEKSEVVEQLFAQVEGQVKPLLDRLLEAETSVSFSAEEFSLLAYFVALLYLRGRSFRAKAHNLRTEFFKQWLKEEAKDSIGFKALAENAGYKMEEKKLEETRELLSNFDEHFTIRVKRGEESELLKQMFDMAQPLSEEVFHKKWQLCESREKIFLTSDNPVTVMQYSDMPHAEVRGFATGIIALPLSPFRCLLLEPGRIRRELKVSQMGRNAVVNVNQSTMVSAHREVYSRFHSPVTRKAFQKTVEGWTEELQNADEISKRWVDEARKLSNESDGSVLSEG